VVPSEKVVGFLFSAWPTAVTRAAGAFHTLANPNIPPPGESYDSPENVVQYVAGWEAARLEATKRGWPMATSADDYESADDGGDSTPEFYLGSKKQAWVVAPDSPSHFQTDWDKFSRALEEGGWVMDFGDGTAGIAPGAPSSLVSAYQNLMQMAFANGWLKEGAVKTAGEEVDTSGWVVCSTCGHPSPHYCENPACPANPTLSDAVLQQIKERTERYRAEVAAREERQRMMEISFRPRASKGASKVSWHFEDGIYTTEVDNMAITIVPQRIGAAWAVTSLDGVEEHVSGTAPSIKAARVAVVHAADIFGQDPNVNDKTNPSKKKNLVDGKEVVDDEEADALEDEVEDGVEDAVEDAVEQADPMSLEVGDTVTVSYTMGTGDAGEVEAVFVRLEGDIAFFSGPSGEFGVAERDGAWVDSDGNTFDFSFGSPDVAEDVAEEVAEDVPEQVEDEVDEDAEKDEDDDDKPDFLKKKKSIRSMAELVTAIGDVNPNLSSDQVFALARQAVLLKNRAASERS
jgi:hypothetical protein